MAEVIEELFETWSFLPLFLKTLDYKIIYKPLGAGGLVAKTMPWRLQSDPRKSCSHAKPTWHSAFTEKMHCLISPQQENNLFADIALLQKKPVFRFGSWSLLIIRVNEQLSWADLNFDGTCSLYPTMVSGHGAYSLALLPLPKPTAAHIFYTSYRLYNIRFNKKSKPCN